jgi:hypothetical protein
MTFLPMLFAAASFVFLIVGVLIFARRRKHYSHLRDTISELGESGCNDSARVAYGLFLPIAILQFATAAAIWNSDHRVAMLALCIGIGYLIAVIAPCDPGSPVSGSTRQGLHNLGGAIEYFGGALSFWNLAQESSSLFFYCGWIVVSGTIAVSIPKSPWRGLFQRLVEITLFGGLIFGCWLTI